LAGGGHPDRIRLNFGDVDRILASPRPASFVTNVHNVSCQQTVWVTWSHPWREDLPPLLQNSVNVTEIYFPQLEETIVSEVRFSSVKRVSL
jgi:hypothetical protein